MEFRGRRRSGGSPTIGTKAIDGSGKSARPVNDIVAPSAKTWLGTVPSIRKLPPFNRMVRSPSRVPLKARRCPTGSTSSPVSVRPLCGHLQPPQLSAVGTRVVAEGEPFALDGPHDDLMRCAGTPASSISHGERNGIRAWRHIRVLRYRFGRRGSIAIVDCHR
jgi:hypothetical protein